MPPHNLMERLIDCNWLLIMETKHSGYCDIVAACTMVHGQPSRLWRYDGRRYSPIRMRFTRHVDMLKGVPLSRRVRAHWNWGVGQDPHDLGVRLGTNS